MNIAIINELIFGDYNLLERKVEYTFIREWYNLTKNK